MATMDANAIAANSEFIRLNQLLNRFNIFEATDMRRREIKHTKFLAYLLDPNESHRLGDAFLYSFLASFSADLEIPLLSLHTELCEVTPEWKQGDDKQKKSTKNNMSVDIYLKIPIHGDLNIKYLHIFIENKINSSQGATQLADYSRMIVDSKKSEDGQVVKLYLTERGEDPSDETWQRITYETNVAAAINQLLTIRHETISRNVKQVLSDYIELIGNDGDINNEIEKLRTTINADLITAIQKRKNIENEWQWKNLRLRFAKAWAYLSELDLDGRLSILKEWEKIKSEQNITINNIVYVFSLEASSRSTLRFSVLTEENRKKLIALSKSSPKKGLESFRNLAFDIGMRNEYYENNTIISNSYLSWAILELGPLDLDHEERNKIVRSLITAVNASKNEKGASPYYTTILPAKKLISTKSRSIEEIKTAISEHLFNFNTSQENIKFVKEFEDTIVKLNSALADSFQNINNISQLKLTAN